MTSWIGLFFRKTKKLLWVKLSLISMLYEVFNDTNKIIQNVLFFRQIIIQYKDNIKTQCYIKIIKIRISFSIDIQLSLVL